MKTIAVMLMLSAPFLVVRAQHVALTHDADARKVDVIIDESLFTSYLYTTELPVLKKPTLYPVHSARGAQLTRHYPLESRAGERTDHPHQIGLWFAYGNVNGLDFWNNSDAIPPERSHEMGTILHRDIEEMEDGDGSGTLRVRAEWVDHEGHVHLDERTTFVFHASEDFRAIDRTTVLTAVNGAVDMADNKEGLLGMRVRRELEMPVTEPIQLTDANGNLQEVAVMDNEGVGGHYRNSEGISGYPDVWGKRARWTALTGTVDGEDVTIAVFDHPGNPGYPTYWHARDYGLFAANPLGQSEFSEGREALNFAIAASGHVVFRHRIAIFSGVADDDAIEAAWEAFTQ